MPTVFQNSPSKTASRAAENWTSGGGRFQHSGHNRNIKGLDGIGIFAGGGFEIGCRIATDNGQRGQPWFIR